MANGTQTHPEVPTWAPLEQLSKLVPTIVCGDFMYMGAFFIGERGHYVHQFKHVGTRRYLNLDSGGHAYRATMVGTGWSYVLQPLAAAIEHVLS